MARTKRKKIPLYKYNVGTLDHIRLVGSKNGKDLIIAEMQKKKPNYLVKNVLELKKNPEKEFIYYETTNPYGLKIFWYKNNPDWFFISRSGSFIPIEVEKLGKILNNLNAFYQYIEG
jgi:hypothetical protein